ncbi:tetraacyldisaccharide 4'-kinase [Helicobacter sp. 11S02596-1]|uniref:tetraacyldisaccharide 4'-kinase n=1 Tax=Helicobacter sp. 11S02596-1 TaxID=1476194 RepID=UPI000BA6D042|nr:tetraacyldisaccharide 4'-kinase [Helicobacter sp. 11S02596-1]PAF42446.1 tetraacyldisaccharide 4'-kinase [Helicobacter sp. 11S02596-1]
MRWIERYFYQPSFWQKTLAIVLLPLSALYCLIATIRRKISIYKDFDIPVVSVGNLVAGGSGKTPFIIEIAKDYPDVAIISRGYKRASKGLLVVSLKGEILVSQKEAGDEAYLIAKTLKNASVIVSKKRDLAILKAKELGCKVVFLDDGFRFAFKKLNILLKPKLEPYFRFPIPSGLYRENPSLYTTADILALEGLDYKREVSITNPTERMLLVTAIANPSRLEEYLPNIVGKVILPDHAPFDLTKIACWTKEHNATSLLVTQKDEVKLQDCPIPLSTMRLNLHIDAKIKEKIYEYIKANKI